MTHPIYGNKLDFMESMYMPYGISCHWSKVTIGFDHFLPWQPPNNNSAAGLINEIVGGRN